MALLAHWSTMLANFLGLKASVFFPRPIACKSSQRSLSVVGRAVAMLLTAALFASSVASAAAAPLAAAPVDSPLEMRVPNGQFFTQANGQGGGNWLGYTVSDDLSAPFWTAFQRLGGVNTIGYPVSGRFEWKGHITQAFQKLVMQWHPETQQVAFVNVFDELTLAGKDSWLQSVRSTPGRLVLDETGKPWNEVVNDRLSFLDANQAIRTQYFSTPDYLNRYGLPTSRVEDVGNAYVIRLQRAVMQQWKVDVPWARAGEVTVANGGDIGKEARLYPEHALQLENILEGAGRDLAPKNPGALTVVIDPGHGGKEPGAIHRFADGSTLYEKDVNLKVATGLGNELYRLGYNVVMTRRTDTQVNGTRDITGDGRVTTNDDLQARVDIANAAKADIFISVHHNGSGNEHLRGTEVYYCNARPFASQSRDLAMMVQAGLMRSLREAGYPAVDRGYKDDSKALGAGRHFFLLGPQSRLVARPSNMPAIIGEGLFVSNDQEAELLRQEGFLAALARGYVYGVNQYAATRGR